MKRKIFSALVALAIFALCLLTLPANSQIQTYTVTNSSGMIVTGVSLSPNDANLWGLNLNTTGSVSANGTFEFTRIVDKSSCIYDVRYLGDDGNYYYMQNVDLCATTTITLLAPDIKRDLDKK